MGRDRHIAVPVLTLLQETDIDCAKYTENVYYTGLGSHTLNLAF